MKTDNEYLADYLGWKLCERCGSSQPIHYMTPEGQAVFDTDFKRWDRLMPIVEKICQHVDPCLPPKFRTFGELTADNKFMVRIHGHQLFEADTLLDATYAAVLDFIKGLKQNVNENN